MDVDARKRNRLHMRRRTRERNFRITIAVGSVLAIGVFCYLVSTWGWFKTLFVAGIGLFVGITHYLIGRKV